MVVESIFVLKVSPLSSVSLVSCSIDLLAQNLIWIVEQIKGYKPLMIVDATSNSNRTSDKHMGENQGAQVIS